MFTISAELFEKNLHRQFQEVLARKKLQEDFIFLINILHLLVVVVVEVAKVVDIMVDVVLEETFKISKIYAKTLKRRMINGGRGTKKSFLKPMFGTCW